MYITAKTHGAALQVEITTLLLFATSQIFNTYPAVAAPSLQNKSKNSHTNHQQYWKAITVPPELESI